MSEMKHTPELNARVAFPPGFSNGVNACLEVVDEIEALARSKGWDDEAAGAVDIREAITSRFSGLPEAEAIAAWNTRASQASDVNMDEYWKAAADLVSKNVELASLIREMLEALQAQELLASLRMPGDVEQNIIKVREMRRAAISKAEGSQP